jgi:hypothetical protein
MTADDMNAIETRSTPLPWDAFFGHVSAHIAHVYVRVARDESQEPFTLRGWVRGPRCRHSRTLPAQFPLRDLGSGPTHLAEARVTDPTFWSPELPAIYDLNVEFCRQDCVLQQFRATVGIRRLGSVNQSLRLEQQRWVPRGLSLSHPTPADIASAREHDVALRCDRPSDAVCAEASEQGVLMIADVSEPDPFDELRRLARWASVGMVIVPNLTATTMTHLRKQLPNLLFAQPVHPGQTTVERSVEAAGYDLFFCEVDDVASYHVWASTNTQPVIVQRRTREPVTIATARAACDRFQRDLAPPGNEAGYFVQGR